MASAVIAFVEAVKCAFPFFGGCLWQHLRDGNARLRVNTDIQKESIRLNKELNLVFAW